VNSRESAGVLVDITGEFDWTNGLPVVLQGVNRVSCAIGSQVMVASGSGDGGADLGIGRSAGQRCITAVPQRGGEIGHYKQSQRWPNSIFQPFGVNVLQDLYPIVCRTADAVV